MKPYPLIVSYYTRRTSYEKEALFLKQSCEKLKLNHHIEAIDSLGSWEKNCCFKPTFLKQQLLNHKQSLLWLDCDAIIVKPPYILNDVEEDIAVRYIQEAAPSHPSKVMSGTLFIKYNPKVLEFLELWEKHCLLSLEKDEHTWDQIVLRNLLTSKNVTLSFFSLPKAYCQVYDKMETRDDLKKATIIHFQASRLTQKSYLGELSPLFLDLQLETKKQQIEAIALDQSLLINLN